MNIPTNIFKAKNTKLILSTTQGNANEFVTLPTILLITLRYY